MLNILFIITKIKNNNNIEFLTSVSLLKKTITDWKGNMYCSESRTQIYQI